LRREEMKRYFLDEETEVQRSYYGRLRARVDVGM
jgi:hypothetical protein